MLVPVVGPSGAGKDTLMAAARARLAGDARFLFARRCITRPAEAGGEDHIAMSVPEFEDVRDAEGFAFWWAAHGLLYGIPREAEAALAAGRVVVANLSRTVLAEAAARWPMRVLFITAPLAVLAARLAARGREDTRDIGVRLAREAVLPSGLEVETVMNDSTDEEGRAGRGLGEQAEFGDAAWLRGSVAEVPGQRGPNHLALPGRQAAGQRDVEPPLLEQVMVAPLVQVVALARRHARGIAAGDLGLTGRRAVAVERGDAGIAEGLEVSGFRGFEEGEEAVVVGEFKRR